MTIEKARALIPPGWVECDEKVWNVTASLAWAMQSEEWVIYAIPAPKEPRRVPMVCEIHFPEGAGGAFMPGYQMVRNALGDYEGKVLRPVCVDAEGSVIEGATAMWEVQP